jgi:hypothetical protein
MTQPITDAIVWLKQKLRQSKTQYKPWGRQIIDAIDLDDCCVLSEIFSPIKYRFKRPKQMDKNGKLREDKEEQPRDINCQVKHNDGYDGHIWTPWIHNFTGDTALHISIKQKKINCTCMLLILDARYDIKNYKGITSADLCFHVYGCTIEHFKNESFRTLLKSMPPDKIDLIPIRIPFKLNSRIADVNKEATSLMWAGRSVFTNAPKSIGFSKIKPGGSRLWQEKVDYLSRKPYMLNIFTGQTRRLNEEEYKIYCQDFERLEIVDVNRLEFEEKNLAKNNENMRKIKEKHEQNRLNRENLYKNKAIIEADDAAKLLEDEKKADDDEFDTTSKKDEENSIYSNVVKDEEEKSNDENKIDDSTKLNGVKEENIKEDKEKEVNIIENKEKEETSKEDKENEETSKEDKENEETSKEDKAKEETSTEDNEKEDKEKEETSKERDARSKKKRDEKNKKNPVKEIKKKLTFKEMEEEKKIEAERLHAEQVERIRLEYLEISEEEDRQAEVEKQRLSSRKFLYKHKRTGEKSSECPKYFEDDEDECYEEMIKLRKLENEKKLLEYNKNEKLRSARDFEMATGISLNPGAKGAGDVWANGTITDIVRTLKAQNLRFRKMEQLDALRKSGLSLLTEAKIGMDEVQFGVPMDSSLSDKIIDSLPQLQGLKKLKFTRIRNLRKYNTEIDMEKDEIDFPVRLITELSTRNNMKYMDIGDTGLSSLSNVLTKNKTIQTICLTGARVTSESVCILAANLSQILSLTYLDLSQNAICDKGCIALAIALCPSMKSSIESRKKTEYIKSNSILSGVKIDNKIIPSEDNIGKLQEQEKSGRKRAGKSIISKYLPPLKTLSLMGNRISHNGAEIIVEATHNRECKLSFLSIARNKLSEEEIDSLSIKSNQLKNKLIKLLNAEKTEFDNKNILNKKHSNINVESSNDESNKSIVHFENDMDEDNGDVDISLVPSLSGSDDSMYAFSLTDGFKKVII